MKLTIHIYAEADGQYSVAINGIHGCEDSRNKTWDEVLAILASLKPKDVSKQP